MFDAEMLSRIQFAANITFHILFPTFTIGLAWILLYFKARFHRSGDMRWMHAYRFWVKVFALCFALGIVSGITMSFQFGTNWPGFMNKVGNIAGPLLAYEVMTAFFMEATFLGIMLYGMGRVRPWVHTTATALVAIGTTLSAFWIMVLSAWMHTPAGYVMIDGVAHIDDWWAIVFNPSMPYRLIHMLLASGLAAAFLVAGISAYRWRRGDQSDDVRLALRTGVFLGAILAPIQVVSGDLLGLNTLEHQPQKIAAIEGVWNTEAGAPLLLFALPNQTHHRNDVEIGIPKLASLILTHDPNGVIRGLNDFDQPAPPVAAVFWSFRIMVGAGVMMLFLGLVCAWRLYRSGMLAPWQLRALVPMTFSGWVATVAGWYVTEIGRQPYLVYGLLLTRDAATTTPPATIGISLALYLTVYTVLLVAFISTLFYLARQASGRNTPHPRLTPTGAPA